MPTIEPKPPGVPIKNGPDAVTTPASGADVSRLTATMDVSSLLRNRKVQVVSGVLLVMAIALISTRVYLATRQPSYTAPVINQPVEFLSRDTVAVPSSATALALSDDIPGPYTVIGHSVEKREIRAYRCCTGDQAIVFVGGLHGGYEWNTSLLAYELINHYRDRSDTIPSDISIIIIPVANPDGLHKGLGVVDEFTATEAPDFRYATDVSPEDVVFASRFNAHEVDLNRNFDCDRGGTAQWREYTVNAGKFAFSEPETLALRDYLFDLTPRAVLLAHSASNGVYLSQCDGPALQETVTLLSTYSTASGYPKYNEYRHYKVTGDAADWLAKIGIAAITIDLSTHNVTEFSKNLAGMQGLIALYSAFQ